MPLFRKAEPEPVAGGGKDVVRAMVRNRTRTPGAMSLVREELHVSNDAISAFGGGADNLTPEQINRVLVYFSWNATYDPSADLLVSKAAKATSMGSGPPIGSGGSMSSRASNGECRASFITARPGRRSAPRIRRRPRPVLGGRAGRAGRELEAKRELFAFAFRRRWGGGADARDGERELSPWRAGDVGTASVSRPANDPRRINHPRRDLARNIGICPASPPNP